MVQVHRDPITQVASAGSYNGGTIRQNATVATTDATATVIFSIPLAELAAIKVQGHVVGMKTDATSMIDAICDGGWRRAAAGNVTACGSPVVTAREDSAGTPAVTWNANTTAQTVELKVTGIVAENWHWEVHYSYTKIA